MAAKLTITPKNPARTIFQPGYFQSVSVRALSNASSVIGSIHTCGQLGIQVPTGSSKRDLQRKLGQARRAGEQDAAKIGGGHIRNGQFEIGVIRYVEEFSAELDTDPFGHAKCLDGRGVEVSVIKTASDVAAGIAELPCLSNRIETLRGGRVRPLLHGVRPLVGITDAIGAACVVSRDGRRGSLQRDICANEHGEWWL